MPSPCHTTDTARAQHHASCVCIGNAALLIIGPPKSGKSSLALDLISRGASLVSDDQTQISAQDHGLYAAPPPTLQGLIEARGLGILRLSYKTNIKLCAVVDLSTVEPQRSPDLKTWSCLDQDLPCFYAPHTTPIAAPLLLMLQNPSLIDAIDPYFHPSYSA